MPPKRTPLAGVAAAEAGSASLRRARQAMGLELDRLEAVTSVLGADAAALSGVAASHAAYGGEMGEADQRITRYRTAERQAAWTMRLALAAFCCLAAYIAARRLLPWVTGWHLP